MPQKTGIGRAQMMVFCAEQQIAEDNPVRVIDAFVDTLDLKTLKFKLRGTAQTGRSAYTAPMLLKLYCYGYLNRIRSSRRLEAECQRNIELWWLLEQQTPCYKTISDFRKDNTKALQNTFKEFVQMCRNWQLFGAETVAIDGAKFRAQNSKKNNYNEKKINQHLQYIDQKTEDYLAELDRLDAAETQAQQQVTSEQNTDKQAQTKQTDDHQSYSESSEEHQQAEEQLLQSLQNKNIQRQRTL